MTKLESIRNPFEAGYRFSTGKELTGAQVFEISKLLEAHEGFELYETARSIANYIMDLVYFPDNYIITDENVASMLIPLPDKLSMNDFAEIYREFNKLVDYYGYGGETECRCQAVCNVLVKKYSNM